MFIVSKETMARKQLLTNPSLCMQYRNTHPSGFALGIRALPSEFVLLYCIQTSGIGQ